jgi:hypothetical protein
MKTPGNVAYDAYMDFTGGVSLTSGQPLPEWDKQSDRHRAAWEAAAEAVALRLMERIVNDLELKLKGGTGWN